MTQNETQPEHEPDAASEWMKNAGAFRGQMLKSWGDLAAHWGQAAPLRGAPGAQKTASSMERMMKAFQSVSSALGEPDSMASIFKGAGAMPELLAKMAQTALAGFLTSQQRWVEQVSRIGKRAKAYSFEDLDDNAFRAWAEIYEREFRQFFHLPQLGLTRQYQEKINQVADRFNLLQMTLGEFGRLLYLPIGRSMTVMQERLGELAQAGQLPEDSKSYYQMWIKILEGHYMNLFQSKEYIQTLGRTLQALGDFSAAKNRVLEEVLATLPIAHQKDLDELGREIYLLKKRIRTLEKAAAGKTVGRRKSGPTASSE